MLSEELHSFVRRRPFEPFRVYLTDGARYDVSHPDMLMPGQRSLVVGLPADLTKPFERFVTIAVSHVWSRCRWSRFRAMGASASSRTIFFFSTILVASRT